MAADFFDKIRTTPGELGQYFKLADGYYMFPELEGELGPHMTFQGKKMLVWSLNNYLGLANHPEVRKADAQGAAEYGMAYPMGSRMMSGQTKKHRELEQKLAKYVGKQDAFLLNFGYQGMLSVIDALCNRHDVIVYDSNSHACILDGVRLHIGKRFMFHHNDMESLTKQLEHATKLAEKQNGGVLVITEGVFGMVGDVGRLDQIVALKSKYKFRLLVDDAHGFGIMGKRGSGVPEHFNVIDGVDLHFATFAKSMAGIGGFIACDTDICNYLRYNMRSQIYAKSLPMPMVIGALKRLELIETQPQLREKLYTIVNALQNGLKAEGFDLGATCTPVTPVYLKGGPAEATHVVKDLRDNYGIFCSIVVYPVIPKGNLILRIMPTAAHSLEDVHHTINAFKEVRAKLQDGKYSKEEFAKVK